MSTVGDFTFYKMDEATARMIAGWRYDAPYDVYNGDPDEAEGGVQCFLNPRYNYYSIFDEQGALTGYCCFGEDARVPGGDYRADALDIGVGLRPDLTGQGLGNRFVETVTAFAGKQFTPEAFRATVAAFNKRALRVCEKSGYRQTQIFKHKTNGMRFIILMLEQNSSAHSLKGYY